MAIFRGEGGAGDSTNDATLGLVTAQAVIASTKASDAASAALTEASAALVVAVVASPQQRQTL
jgi:hypothetical protein